MLLQKMPSARRSAAPRSEGNHSVVVAGVGRGRNSIRARSPLESQALLLLFTASIPSALVGPRAVGRIAPKR